MEYYPEANEESVTINLFKKYRKGDLNSRNEIIEHNMRLVIYIAKKFSNHDIEELISVGFIGLIKATDSFDIDKEIKFVTYASRCIENEMLMFIRKNNRHKMTCSIEEKIGKTNNDCTLLIKDILESSTETINEVIENENKKENLKHLKNLLYEELTPKENLLIQLSYGFINDICYRQLKIAEILGISQSYVSRQKKKIIKKLLFSVKKNNINY